MCKTKKYMSDVIGEDYKKWNNTSVIFNGDTGCGKTFFVFSVLIPYAKSQRKEVLYLCNRSPLYKQLLQEAAKHTNVVLMTYQRLQNQIRDGVKLKHYDYIVSDECHYFQSDAMFNGYTDVSLNFLLGQLNSVVIYMSATASTFFTRLIQDGIVPKKYCYTIKKNYAYVEKIYMFDKADLTNIIDYILECNPDEKILIYLNSIDRLNEMHGIYADSADYICGKNQKIPYCDNNCIKDKRFKKRILFTTKALDNGVDIVDENLMHIISELFDLDSTMQAIGRKRPIDMLDTCRLYFRRYDKRGIQNFYKANQKQLKPAKAYLENKNTFIEKISSYGYDERQIARDSKVFYTDWKDNQTLKINPVCYQKLSSDEAYLQRMLNSSYEDVLMEYLGVELSSKLSELDISLQTKDKFAEYLSEIEGQKLFKSEQAKLKEQFQDILGLRDRTMGINTLNGKLQDCMYPYGITSKQENSRQSPNYKKRYWLITRI